MSSSYNIQVQKTQNSSVVNNAGSRSYCSKLDENGTGWRLPTQIELHAMYLNKSSIESTSGSGVFNEGYYWSGTRYNGNNNNPGLLHFGNGKFNYLTTSNSFSIRCVRDL